MFPWSLLLNPTVLIGIALAGALGTAAIQTSRLHSAQDRIQTITAQHAAFVAQVEANGKIAQQRANTQAAADKLRAKEADDEAKKRYSSLDAQYAQYRLRQQSGNGATGRIVSASSPGAVVNSTVCYTRETVDRELTGALERFRGRLTDSVQPYDQAAIVARTCKDWAVGR